MNNSELDPVDDAAEEFVARYRRGERPSLTEYVRKYPALSEKIRALFPALVAMEELGSVAAPPRQRSDPEEAIPQQLGDYHIVREMARGGMGIVYEAVQQCLGRHVALKVLPSDARTNSNQLNRFQAEARAAARLHHTNIVPVFEVGEHNGIHYFAMQYIHGQSLSSVLEEVKRLRGKEGPPIHPVPALVSEVAGEVLSGQFSRRGRSSQESVAGAGSTAAPGAAIAPAAEAAPSTSTLLSGPAGSYHRSVAEVGLQVAEALEYAHQQRILHRDIKPSNLMLDTKGTVWVMDFGLAKAGGEEDLTRAGDVVGTVRYMAPERFQGKADARSDVYSLGLTLFEMVALRPAFTFEDRARLVEGILRCEPPPLRKLEPRVPRDLETIILKAIAKELAHRYATAADMADDLRRFLADRPVRARRARRMERTWRWCRRNPLVAALTGAVAALLVTVATVAGLMAWSLRKEEAATRGQLQLTRQAEQEGRRRLFRTLLEEARASRLSGRMGRRFHSLEVLDEAAAIAREMKLPAADFRELRNETIACLALLDLRVDSTSPSLPMANSNVDLNGTFDIYARGDRSGNISVRRLAGDVEVCRIPSGLSFPGVRFSPDGRHLAGWEHWGRHLKVWKLAGSKAEVVVDEPSEPLYDFNPAGDQLALGHSNGSIDLVDLSCGRRRHLAVAPSPRFVAFHPKLPRLAIAYRDKVQVLDLETGKIIGNVPVQDVERYIAWHPDGKTLATSGMDRAIYLWDVASGKQTARLEGHKHIGQVMGFDPSGDLLASVSWDGNLRLWDSRTGRQLFVTQTVWHHFLHFSSDGRLLGPGLDLEGRKLKLWEVAMPCGYRTLVRDPVWGRENYAQFAISPDGRLLVAGMPDGLAFWDLASGRPVKFLPAAHAESVLFETSGDLLTTRGDAVYRLSIRPDLVVPEGVRLGGGEKLPLADPAGSLAESRDGRVVAVGRSWSGALVWSRDLPGPPIPVPHEDVRSVAVSPDGAWVATSSHDTSLMVKIWEARTGRLVKSLPVGPFNLVGFSPDGQWLATNAAGLQLWKAPSWEQGPHIGGSAFAFSHDGKMVAVETGSGCVRLVALATGAEIARFEDPEQDRAVWLGFTPDGTQLVSNGEGQALHVWDLRVIGEQLSQRNLPWDLPLPPPDKPQHTDWKPRSSNAPSPLQITVEPRVLALTNVISRARGQQDLGRWGEAICLFSLAIDLDPRSVDALNGLAWLCGTCADARYRNPAEAVTLAERAIALAPSDGNLWNTLGVAHYRNGNWSAAIKALGKSIQLRQGGNDCFFLAMAHWKLGAKELARRWYARGALWIARQAARNEESLGFRSEAADLLGIALPLDLPAANDDVAYYTFFLDLEPNAVWARHQRALAYGGRAQWDQAAADLAELVKVTPEKLELWCEYASVLLLQKDYDRYRGVCQSVLKHFGQSQDVAELYLLSRILALASHDVTKPPEVVERVWKAVRAGGDRAWFRHTLAVALYRAGRFERALEQAEKSLEDRSWTAHVVNWLLLAMLHEKLGHHRDARQWLDKSLKWLDQEREETSRQGAFLSQLPSWADRLEVELLRREARALIKGEEPGKAEKQPITRR